MTAAVSRAIHSACGDVCSYCHSRAGVPSLRPRDESASKGFDDTWKALYAAVAEDLAERHRSFSAVAFGEMADLESSDRLSTQRILSRTELGDESAMDLSGASAESGFRWRGES
jgi:hypothetical protein